ncbi:hypothetical protein [Methylobacterium ajmalii]|uniref:DUF5983 family protein n=1 Tax=Methylobacterium ajmalii TaxID=2738439 RepID=UPI002F35E200
MREPLLKYPLRAFLDLGTTHLTPVTLAMMQSEDLHIFGVTGGETAYGFFIGVPEERPDQLDRDDLWACLAKAREMGADYVLFDRDADTAGQVDLPVYDHTDPTLEGWVPAF